MDARVNACGDARCYDAARPRTVPAATREATIHAKRSCQEDVLSLEKAKPRDLHTFNIKMSHHQKYLSIGAYIASTLEERSARNRCQSKIGREQCVKNLVHV